jgi:hypothetical protein
MYTIGDILNARKVAWGYFIINNREKGCCFPEQCEIDSGATKCLAVTAII